MRLKNYYFVLAFLSVFCRVYCDKTVQDEFTWFTVFNSPQYPIFCVVNLTTKFNRSLERAGASNYVAVIYDFAPETWQDRAQDVTVNHYTVIANYIYGLSICRPTKFGQHAYVATGNQRVIL